MKTRCNAACCAQWESFHQSNRAQKEAVPLTGVAAMLKSVDPSVHVVGCQPAASDVMRASVAAGRILDRARPVPTAPRPAPQGRSAFCGRCRPGRPCVVP